MHWATTVLGVRNKKQFILFILHIFGLSSPTNDKRLCFNKAIDMILLV